MFNKLLPTPVFSSPELKCKYPMLYYNTTSPNTIDFYFRSFMSKSQLKRSQQENTRSYNTVSAGKIQSYNTVSPGKTQQL